MDRKKAKLALKGMVSGGINKIICLLLPFVTRTVMIYTLGAQYLGLNSVFTSILSILSFAELGFGTVMVYSMYRPIAEHDNDTLQALLNLYKKLYRIIGLIVLVIGLAIMPFLNNFISGEHPEDVNLYVLYVIYLFNSVISYWLFIYKGSLLDAHQMYYVYNNISIVITILTYGLQIVALLLFNSYYVYVIVVPLATIANNIATALMARKYFPTIRPIGHVDKETARDIRKNVLSGIGHKLGPSATTSIDNLVVSSYSGLLLAAVYNNYNFILNFITGFISLIFTNFTAGIGNSIVTESVEKNYEDYNFFTFINNIVTGLCSILLLCLCQPFMYLWVGKNYGEDYMYSNISVLILVLMFYAQQVRTITITYKSAAGMWYADRWKPYVAAVSNAILDIILIRLVGINGILLSTILARACIGLPWETRAFFKQYFHKPQMPYYLNLLKYFLVNVLIGCLAFFICELIPYDNFGLLIVRAFISLSISVVLLFFVYYKNEHMLRIRRIIKDIVLRKR